MAGIDMSMVPNDYSFADHLVALVKEGAVPQTRIDEAVRRILRVKFELGLFEKPMPDASQKRSLACRNTETSASRQRVSRSRCWKNSNNILPLSKNTKVLVTGPTSDSLVSMNNGWTWVWQGSEESLSDRSIDDSKSDRSEGWSVEFQVGTGDEDHESTRSFKQYADGSGTGSRHRSGSEWHRTSDVVVLRLAKVLIAKHPATSPT